MASTFSPTLRLELIGDGDQSGIWGQTTNTNLGTLLEQAITGVANITMVNANYTLTNFNGVSDESRNAVLVVGGTNGAVRDIIAPLVRKLYVVRNNTTGGFAINIRGATGSSVSIPNGATVWVYCDGTNFNSIGTESIGNFEVNGNLTVTGNTNAVAATYTGNVSALNLSTAGNVTATTFIGAGSGLTSINASNISTGTIANARTTAASANGANTIVTRDANGSFSANIITATLTGNAASITDINASNITSGTVASARISGSYTGITGVGTLLAGTWSGNTVGVLYGGTGTTTSTGSGSVVLSASPALTGTPTAPTAANGTNTTQIATTAFVNAAVVTATGSLGTMSTQNANNVSITGGNISNVTITNITDLAVADGGTGSSSLAANAVLLGNGTSALQTVAPGTAGNILVSNGTTWSSSNVAASGAKLGLGITGEVWNNVTGSRSFGVTYTNTRSYPIAVSANTGASGPSPYVEVVVSGVRTSLFYWQFNGAGAVGGASPVIVPPGATYVLNANAGLSYWAELY